MAEGEHEQNFEYTGPCPGCGGSPHRPFPGLALPTAECVISAERFKTPDAAERKKMPVCTGVFDYFPDALMEVARVSYEGTSQHHPEKALHWDKSKSKDEADALARHLLERGTRDTDGMRHTAKVAWRALALLQRELDREKP